MLLHFQYKPLYQGQKLPGWRFSFFYQNIHYRGTYNGNGTIEWQHLPPNEDEKKQLEKQIHELMIYHVYE
ncbi:MAG TPA: YheE family protein [Chondromyces sp.]|nr:YheE family protein [Chondromyces sp.]